MANIEEILSIPERWRRQEDAWERLTTGDTLFRVLYEAVRQGSIGRAKEWVEEWKSFVKRGDEKVYQQWCIARKLVWCADQGATQAPFYRKEIDRVCFALKKLPGYIQEDKVWAWCCIRTFLELAARCIEVPVAFWNEGEGKGFLATLCLEVIERGAGQIAHHPADVFCTDVNEDFRLGIEDAWISANNLVKEEGKEVLYDGKWRLYFDGQALPVAKGRSASGAGSGRQGLNLAGESPVVSIARFRYVAIPQFV